MNKVFAHEVQVNSADCDPAGIVFYPQFLMMTEGAKDNWFARGLGRSRLELLSERRLAVEPDEVRCDFSLPVRMGEALRFELSVLEVKDASVRIRIVGKRHRRAIPVSGFSSGETGRAPPCARCRCDATAYSGVS